MIKPLQPALLPQHGSALVSLACPIADTHLVACSKGAHTALNAALPSEARSEEEAEPAAGRRLFHVPTTARRARRGMLTPRAYPLARRACDAPARTAALDVSRARIGSLSCADFFFRRDALPSLHPNIFRTISLRDAISGSWALAIILVGLPYCHVAERWTSRQEMTRDPKIVT